jgi:hypothetical protein
VIIPIPRERKVEKMSARGGRTMFLRLLGIKSLRRVAYYAVPLVAISLIGYTELKQNKKAHSVFSSQLFSNRMVAFCQEQVEKEKASSPEGKVDEKKPVEPIMIEDVEDDSEWENSKQSCSFCKGFLQSPCKEPFRKWSKCVDKAKELDVDFIESCKHYTLALMACTEQNETYFTSLSSAMAERKKEEVDGEEDDEQEEDDHDKVEEVENKPENNDKTPLLSASREKETEKENKPK